MVKGGEKADKLVQLSLSWESHPIGKTNFEDYLWEYYQGVCWPRVSDDSRLRNEVGWTESRTRVYTQAIPDPYENWDKMGTNLEGCTQWADP